MRYTGSVSRSAKFDSKSDVNSPQPSTTPSSSASSSGWLSRKPGEIFAAHFAAENRLISYSGAQIVYRSFLQPVFAKYFSAGSTAANLKAQSEKAQ
jgi:hypothetical protein